MAIRAGALLRGCGRNCTGEPKANPSFNEIGLSTASASLPRTSRSPIPRPASPVPPRTWSGASRNSGCKLWFSSASRSQTTRFSTSPASSWPRTLSVADFDDYNVAVSSVLVLTSLATLGLEKYALRCLPAWHNHQDWARSSGFLQFSRRLILVTWRSSSWRCSCPRPRCFNSSWRWQPPMAGN